MNDVAAQEKSSEDRINDMVDANEEKTENDEECVDVSKEKLS